MKRSVVVVGIALAAFIYSLILLSSRPYGAGDLTWPISGAFGLVHGSNPYFNPLFGPSHAYPYNDPLLYPLPAVLLTIPLLPIDAFSSAVAGATFFGLVSAALAYALTANNDYSRLPVFLSPSFYIAAMVAQWSPLLLAALFLPWLMPLGIVKPNLFVGAVAHSGMKRSQLAAIILIVGASLVILPSWPIDWLGNLRQQHHLPAILTIPGLALIPALLFVRQRNARLILALAIIPQLLFWYDQLLLWAIPRTLAQSIFLTTAAWVGYGAWLLRHQGEPINVIVPSAAPWVVAFTFLPAFALVVWQSWRSEPAADMTVAPHGVEEELTIAA